MTSKNIWIIGASSGIGAALARQLAKRGHKIALSARRAGALEELKEQLNGDGHLAIPVDAGDLQNIEDGFDILKSKWNHVDSVIFMAGLYTPSAIIDIDMTEAQKIMQVNFMGAMYTVKTVLPALLEQGMGQIALCSSVAGYRGLPNSQPYGASKAAMINYTESLRAEHGKTLDIKMINPGFVETRLTDKNNFKMPMRITPEKAAVYIAKGLEKSSFDIHFPKKFTYLVKLLAALPAWLYFKIMTQG